MNIPPHIQVAFAIGEDASLEELENAVDGSPVPSSAFGLSTADFMAAVSDLDESDVIDVSRLSRVPSQWRYLEVSTDGSRQSFGICTPANADVPITHVGQAAVKAWFGEERMVENEQTVPGVLVRSVAQLSPLKDFARDLIETWAKLPLFPEEFNVPPIWATRNQIIIPATSRILKSSYGSKYDSLLIEAVSEIKSKWRYLSLYRILEHGYLSEIFETLQAEFFQSPHESLDRAIKSVESELQQFTALAETASLKGAFESLFDEFQKAKAANNKFAWALDRSLAKSGQQQNRQKWQNGVLICYKIRNSIVHSGLSSPIFDAYQDSSDCLDVLLPTLEFISLSFLDVTVA
jgi:hypothetical protein